MFGSSSFRSIVSTEEEVEKKAIDRKTIFLHSLSQLSFALQTLLTDEVFEARCKSRSARASSARGAGRGGIGARFPLGGSFFPLPHWFFFFPSEQRFCVSALRPSTLTLPFGFFPFSPFQPPSFDPLPSMVEVRLEDPSASLSISVCRPRRARDLPLSRAESGSRRKKPASTATERRFFCQRRRFCSSRSAAAVNRIIPPPSSPSRSHLCVCSPLLNLSFTKSTTERPDLREEEDRRRGRPRQAWQGPAEAQR